MSQTLTSLARKANASNMTCSLVSPATTAAENLVVVKVRPSEFQHLWLGLRQRQRQSTNTGGSPDLCRVRMAVSTVHRCFCEPGTDDAGY